MPTIALPPHATTRRPAHAEPAGRPSGTRERMLGDGSWSPMYRPAGAGALRWLVVVATAALEPIPAQL